jgi:hypothetical protein
MTLPPVVLYIGGSGRSGSTLLDRMLGQVPGMWSTGELARVWDSGARDNQLCGCGEPFLSCPFWVRVGEAAFGGWSAFDVDRAVQLQHLVRRHRYLPLILMPRLSSRFAQRIREFDEMTQRLYSAILEVSGCTVLVDSTKEASYAYLLRRVLRDRLRVVHLVRESRGVAFSWTKTVRMPDRADTEVHLPRYHPGRMALRWVAYNGLFDALAASGVPTLVVHYESLVSDPATELAAITEHAGLPPSDDQLAFVRGNEISLAPGHTVSGNPMRFSDGTLRLRLDDAWKTRMPRRQQWLVQLLSSPALVRYGYLPRRYAERRTRR